MDHQPARGLHNLFLEIVLNLLRWLFWKVLWTTNEALSMRRRRVVLPEWFSMFIWQLFGIRREISMRMTRIPLRNTGMTFMRGFIDINVI